MGLNKWDKYKEPPFFTSQNTKNCETPNDAYCNYYLGIEQPFSLVIICLVGVAFILLRILKLILGIVVMTNFKKGLLEVFSKQKVKKMMYNTDNSASLEILLNENGEIEFKPHK